MNDLEILMSIKEVAELEAVSYEKIKKDIKCGKIKAIKNYVTTRRYTYTNKVK